MKELLLKYDYELSYANNRLSITKVPGGCLLKALLISVAGFIGWWLGSARVEEEMRYDGHVMTTEGFWGVMNAIFSFLSYLPLYVIAAILLIALYNTIQEHRWKLYFTPGFIQFKTDGDWHKWRVEEIEGLEQDSSYRKYRNEEGEHEVITHSLYLVPLKGDKVELLSFTSTKEDPKEEMEKIKNSLSKLIGKAETTPISTLTGKLS